MQYVPVSAIKKPSAISNEVTRDFQLSRSSKRNMQLQK